MNTKFKQRKPSYGQGWCQLDAIDLTANEVEKLLLHHDIMYQRGRQDGEHSGEYLDFFTNSRSKRTGEKIGKILTRASEAKATKAVA